MPAACPACGQPLVRPEGEGHHFCENVDCPSRIAQSLIHLASRGALDIEGLGEKTVTQFRAARLARTTWPTCSACPTAATRSSSCRAGRTAASTSSSTASAAGSQRPLERLLVALNIRHVGPTVAKELARHLRTLEGIQQAPAEQIAAIAGIGPTIAAAVRAWFDTPRNAELAAALVGSRRAHHDRPRRAGGRRVAGAGGSHLRGHRHARGASPATR